MVPVLSKSIILAIKQSLLARLLVNAKRRVKVGQFEIEPQRFVIKSGNALIVQS